MAEGLFHHLCFSFHDEYEVLNRLLPVMIIGPWRKSNITIWTSTDRPVGRSATRRRSRSGGCHYGTLRGGRLAQNPAPKSVEDVWAKSEYDWTPAAWALQWLWDQPEVSVVLSGMSAMEQVKENIETASTSGVGKLRIKDLALIKKSGRPMTRWRRSPVRNVSTAFPVQMAWLFPGYLKFIMKV